MSDGAGRLCICDSITVKEAAAGGQQSVEARVWSVLTSQLAATSLFTDFTPAKISLSEPRKKDYKEIQT